MSTNTAQSKKTDQHHTRQTAQSAPVLSLAEIQDLFQRAVMDGDGTILNSIPGNGRTTSDVLLGVYQYAYRGRLVEILGIDHPLLKKYMGDAAFDEMAHAYITAHPSHTPNVRWFARDLPKFLNHTERYLVGADLSELAALEQALANAFDAADDAVLSLAELQAVPPENWAALTFQPHASAARLTSHCDIYHLWQRLHDDSEQQKPDELSDETQPLIVWRKEEVARVRVMTAQEAMAWDEVAQGTTFGSLCELLAVYDVPETAPLRAAQFLQTWISAELLTSVRAPKDQR